MPTITIPFEKCSSVIICGASASGKTHFITECIRRKNDLYEPKYTPKHVYYFYGVHQPIFDELEREGVHMFQGCPSPEQIQEISQNGDINMIVLDDLMDKVVNNDHLSKLFTEGCHHLNLCTFFLTQHLFYSGKYTKTIARNTHYFLFTKSPRNLSTILSLTKQVFPGKTKAISDVYNDVSNTPFGILLMDLHPNTPSRFRLRSNIFNEDTTVYEIL